MITRIEVDGFKSLRGFALDFEPFTALIGPNGAGKSNVLDALALLSKLASGDIATALEGGRGLIHEQFSSLDESVEQRGFGALGVITLAVELLLFGSELRFKRLRYEVSLELQLLQPTSISADAARVDRCTLLCETLAAMPKADPWLDRHPHLSSMVHRGDGEVLLSFAQSTLAIDDPQGPARHGPVVLQHVQERTFASDPREWARSPHLAAVADELQQIRVGHLEPRILRESSERGAPRMTVEGAHLARALAVLALPRQDKESEAAAAVRHQSRARILTRFVALIPGARMVEPVPNGHGLQVAVELTDGRKFTSRVLSDGTLRVLGLLTLLETTAPGALLAIEEPENGVYPSRARDLVNIMREAVEGPDGSRSPLGQVVVTSHSPAVLAALMDRPRDILFVDMVRDVTPDGAGPRRTRIRRVAAADTSDRGEHTVSRREIERVLATAMLDDGGGP